MTLKYVLVDDKLYRRTTEDLFVKYLKSDQARVAIGKVHKDICGTPQSAPKMKSLFKKSRFVLVYHDVWLFQAV